MSMESAKAFLEKVKSDEAFKAKLAELNDSEERMNFAKAEGFDFTVEELNEASGDELSEDELDAVAGGGPSLCVKKCAPIVGGIKKDVEFNT